MLTESSRALRTTRDGTTSACVRHRWPERPFVDRRRDALRHDDLIILTCRSRRFGFVNGADCSSATPFDAPQGVIGIGNLRRGLYSAAFGG